MGLNALAKRRDLEARLRLVSLQPAVEELDRSQSEVREVVGGARRHRGEDGEIAIGRQRGLEPVPPGTQHEPRGDRDHDHRDREDRAPRSATRGGRRTRRRWVRGWDGPDRRAGPHEVLQHLAAGGLAMVGILRQHLRDRLRQRGSRRRIRLRHRRRDRGHDALEHDVQRGAHERLEPGQQLVEDHAEREDVGALVDPAAVARLGRHVLRRAGDDPFSRGGRRQRHRPGRSRRRLGVTRDAEVEDLDLPVAGQHQVLGLDVAVDHAVGVGRAHRAHALGMGGGQGLETLAGESPELLERDRPGHAGAQRRALDVLHDDEHVVVELEDVVDRRDPPVVDLAGAPGLAQHRGAPSRVLPLVGTQALERDAAMEQRVLGEQDLATPTAAEDLLDAEASDDHPADGAGLIGRESVGSIGRCHEVPRRSRCGANDPFACGTSILP